MNSTNLATKLLFTTIFIFTFFNNSFAKESNNFIIMLDGTRVDCYDDISLSTEFISFNDSEGKHKSVRQKKIKLMLVYNRLFLNLNISKSMKRLQEVYAYNSKHIITGYWQSAVYLYVWDKDFNLVEGKISFFQSYTKVKIKKNKEKYNEQIEKYFKDCDVLTETFNKNIETGQNINKGISYYKCGGSYDPLESYLNGEKLEKIISTKE